MDEVRLFLSRREVRGANEVEGTVKSSLIELDDCRHSGDLLTATWTKESELSRERSLDCEL